VRANGEKLTEKIPPRKAIAIARIMMIRNSFFSIFIESCESQGSEQWV